MTVILPGMTEEDQRVKISSADPKQQGILDLWKVKVSFITHHVRFLTILKFCICFCTPEHGHDR